MFTVTRNPVSSYTSRTAVSKGCSPSSTWPLGNPHLEMPLTSSTLDADGLVMMHPAVNRNWSVDGVVIFVFVFSIDKRKGLWFVYYFNIQTSVSKDSGHFYLHARLGRV